MKRPLQALFVLLLLGGAKLPVEQVATKSLRESHLLSLPLDMEVRDRIGQMGFAASLGGLRSLVASITYLQAFNAWTNVDWAKVDAYSQLTTSLQPRYAPYWKEAADHMAYDAASNYLNNQSLNPAVRGKLYHDHIARGVEILQQAVRVLPDSALLWNTLAEVYERRVVAPQKAADCYMEVFRITKNIRFARLAGFQYAETQDSALWQKAYDLLKDAYDKNQKVPTLIIKLKDLEKKLHIPEAKRIPEVVLPASDSRHPGAPQGASAPAR